MFKDKNSIYVIAIALVALLTMQGVWVYYAVKQENKFLNAGTRQAAIESLNSIEQKEDSELLITGLDSMLGPINSMAHNAKFKIIMKNGKSSMEVNASDTDHITTTYSVSTNSKNNTRFQIIQSTQKISFNSSRTQKTKSKIKDYEELLKKIIYQSETKNLKIQDRVNFQELIKSLEKNLETRGISIKPELAVKDKNGQMIFKTPSYTSIPGIVLPMFTKDIVFQNYTLHVFYPSTASYIFKRAIGVIILSFIVTVLLVIIILLLYKKMLTEKKLNQYKSDFINNLTHELKTPLATISIANANISSITSQGKLSNINQYTQIINEENTKLNNHIEKVFELSLLEKEKQIFNIEVIDIHEEIKKCVLQNTSIINTKNAKINLLLGAILHTVKVDKFHFMNVISNLIDNALKYNTGDVVIEISTKNIDNKIMISVKDNGVGISKEHQKFIFDKFFRVTNKNIHTTKGFGIGLSYIKQTIELFNGTIDVISEENKGSEFIIKLIV